MNVFILISSIAMVVTAPAIRMKLEIVFYISVRIGEENLQVNGLTNAKSEM